MPSTQSLTPNPTRIPREVHHHTRRSQLWVDPAPAAPGIRRLPRPGPARLGGELGRLEGAQEADV